VGKTRWVSIGHLDSYRVIYFSNKKEKRSSEKVKSGKNGVKME
jgi:hypothetical protein